jgi:transcriptional regulator with XRE-family HTH domain
MVCCTRFCRIYRIAVIYQFHEKYQRKIGLTRRGRRRAPTDEAAREAKLAITEYLKIENISSAELARRAGASPSAAWRVLKESPSRWFSTFLKLHEFVKLHGNARRATPQAAEGLVKQLAQVAGRGGNPSASTAALLRAVADLLESTAGRRGSGG